MEGVWGLVSGLVREMPRRRGHGHFPGADVLFPLSRNLDSFKILCFFQYLNDWSEVLITTFIG